MKKNSKKRVQKKPADVSPDYIGQTRGIRPVGKFLLGIVGAAALITAGLFFWFPKQDRLKVEVNQCHTVNKESRWSCYRSAIQKNYTGTFDAYIKRINDTPGLLSEGHDPSWAIFGTNCHTFGHALGDFIAENTVDRDVSVGLSYCTASCTSGCMMGFHKRRALILQYSDDQYAAFYKACPAASKHQCAHEIGHTLHDKYDESILKVLDSISEKQYGLKPKGTANYVMREKPDMDSPFKDCERLLPPDDVPYCYSGIGHNLFLFSQFEPNGYTPQIESCKNASPEEVATCIAYLMVRIGINESAPRYLEGKPDEGKAVCENIGKISGRNDLIQYCFQGVGGGFGFFLESEYPDFKLFSDRVTAGKIYLHTADLCRKVPSDYVTNCLNGLLDTRFQTSYRLLFLTHPLIDPLLSERLRHQQLGDQNDVLISGSKRDRIVVK